GRVVEPGFGEKNRPIESGRRCLRPGRRDRLETDQAAQRVELDADHAARRWRRIALGHCYPVGVFPAESLGDGSAGTLPVPGVNRRSEERRVGEETKSLTW